jgi:7,8-dihydropterin-6-yl-methyl-4-(beta-D-ribofuranosyl)aminobenzene 5'-phosphate synthase
MTKITQRLAQNITLREVESAEIVSMMDNSVDFLSTAKREEVRHVRKWLTERKGSKWVAQHFRTPIAEHGFSLLIRVFLKGKMHSVLYDTGCSSEGIITNSKRMGIDLSETESIVLSHGHYDHSGGLVTTVKAIDRKNLPIIVHEDMLKTRGSAESNSSVRKLPEFPTEGHVKPAKYIRTRQPYTMADNALLVTGEIPRKTSFEQGLPQHMVFIDGKWQPDSLIRDDRAIVFNVKQKGLVVLSGCAHAGIINTAHYAQQLTGIKQIYAIIGGFHLAGKECETRIQPTVEQLKQLDPTIVAPSHCTGWRGICAIAKEMPQAFVWNSVGDLYSFQALH